MGDLVAAVAQHAEGDSLWQVVPPVVPQGPLVPGMPGVHHTHFLLGPYPRAMGSNAMVWRVKDFFGVCPAARATRLSARAPRNADIILLDDANLGFRTDAARWREVLASRRRDSWVVVKMAPPVADGPLWNHLLDVCPERLVVIMTANDLRLTEVQVSRELSWEQVAQDVAWELFYNPRINSLMQCAAVIVSFDAAGALLMEGLPDAKGRSERAERRIRLVFDPALTESEWRQCYPGLMLGYTSCLTAALAWQVMSQPEEPSIESAIQRGIAAVRQLHIEGYGPMDPSAHDSDIAFPLPSVTTSLTEAPKPIAVVDVPRPTSSLRAIESQTPTRPWSILEEHAADGLNRTAIEVVRYGIETVLHNAPLARIGQLVALDRNEIEAYRSLRQLILEYSRNESQQPLSIAVFGAPGAGKSFGVSEVAKSVLPGRIEKKTFNLSQLAGLRDLLDAFHQVRDISLRGRLPLVFWDEFDAPFAERELGWLRYFLSAMQDGEFQDGQITYAVGRAIFVFAGGTAHSREEFEGKVAPEDKRDLKGMDFVSRLKGFVNVMGPNPAGDNVLADPQYVIRRAALLRQMLASHAPGVFDPPGHGALQIDHGVLHAFLHIRKFKYGARSMQSIVVMSQLKDKRYFERSALPPAGQLDLHVHGTEFMSLVQMIRFDNPQVVDGMARDLHELHRQRHPSYERYSSLSEDKKEQNRENVRDIPNKLAVIGCVMTTARSGATPFQFLPAEIEALAEIEHDRWIRTYLRRGWKWSRKRDDVAKRHPALVPWRVQSPENRVRRYTQAGAAALGPGVLKASEKKKDRDLVRELPRILAKYGYSIERLSGSQGH